LNADNVIEWSGESSLRRSVAWQAWPFAAHAQRSPIPVIGFLFSRTEQQAAEVARVCAGDLEGLKPIAASAEGAHLPWLAPGIAGGLTKVARPGDVRIERTTKFKLVTTLWCSAQGGPAPQRANRRWAE
jgi:hypothetical protein